MAADASRAARRWSATLVAQGIRDLRHHRQLTQQGLADLMGVTQPLIARWEDPLYAGWSLKTLLKIAHVLRARLRIRFEDLHSGGQGE